MLVAVQLPLADVRGFLDEDTHRLVRPRWAPPSAALFVRGVGGPALRLQGPIEPWTDQRAYWRARRAVRYPPGGRWHFGTPNRTVPLHAGPRRLFADSTGTLLMFEGIFAPPSGSRRWHQPALTGDEAFTVATACARIVVSVPAQGGSPKIPLVAAGQPLARHLLRATSAAAALKSGFSPSQAWISPGAPLLLMDLVLGEEIESPPTPSASVPSLQARGIHLHHYLLRVQGHYVRVWFTVHERSVAPDELRRLRAHLMRLHAEQEGLRLVLPAVSPLPFRLERGSPQFETFQSYLNGSLRHMTKQVVGGLPESEILAAAYASDEIVNQGDRAELLRLLNDMRGNLLRLLEEHTRAKSTAAAAPKYIYIERVDKMTEHDESVNITAGGNVMGSGKNIDIKDSFKNISAAVQSSGAPEELRGKLEELTDAVAKMAEQLDPTEADQARRDMEMFAQEAVAPEPRRPILEAVGGGLKKLAGKFADFGPPVISLVAAILVLV